METKAVLLAAGRGTRLLPLTENTSKSLLKIKGKPMIEYILDRLVDIGIKEIIIVIGHFGDKIKNQVGNNYKGVPVKYVFNPIYDKTNSIYSLWLTKDVVNDDFVVINADTLFSKDIIKDIVESDYEMALAIDDTMTGAIPEENMKVTIVNGLIKNASKLIPPEKNHGDAIGLYKFKGKGAEVLFKELKRHVEEKTLDQLFTFAVRSAMNEFDVYPVSTKGLHWIEIDDHNDLKNAEEVVENIIREERIE